MISGMEDALIRIAELEALLTSTGEQCNRLKARVLGLEAERRDLELDNTRLREENLQMIEERDAISGRNAQLQGKLDSALSIGAEVSGAATSRIAELETEKAVLHELLRVLASSNEKWQEWSESFRARVARALEKKP